MKIVGRRLKATQVFEEIVLAMCRRVAWGGVNQPFFDKGGRRPAFRRQGGGVDQAIFRQGGGVYLCVEGACETLRGVF